MLKKKRKSGFTLVELLATVVIITLVMGISIPFILNTINNSEEKSKSLSIANIKKSANYYTKENNNDIIWTYDKNDYGDILETSFTCVSIDSLINKGYLKEKDLNNLSEEQKNKDIIVKRNSNQSIISEEFDDSKVCNNRENVVPIPTSKICNNNIYNGELKNLSTTNESRIILSNNTAINAGIYQVKADLNSNEYYWEDGTKDTKTISCSISKAIPTIEIDNPGNNTETNKNITDTYSTNVKTNIDGIVSLKSSNIEHAIASVDENNNITKDTWKKININIKNTRETTTYITITIKPNDTNNYYSVSTIYTLGTTSYIEVDKPNTSYCTTPTYTGNELDITKASGEGYWFYNYKQTNAGSYSVRAKLKFGYIWKEDKTTSDKIITCSINKATPKITLDPTKGATIIGVNLTFNEQANTSGTFTVTSKDTSIATVKQESSSKITANTKNKVTITPKKVGNTTIEIKFTPSNTTNYNNATPTSYEVNIQNTTTKPSCKTGLIYNGSAQNLVNTDTGYTLSNNSRTNYGSQTVTVKLNSNYRWSDNTVNDLSLSCSIGKKSITVKANDQSKTYDSKALKADSNCTVTNGTLASNHKITCTNTGSQTNAGTSPKTLSSVVIKSGSTDVTNNYEIKKDNGTLTVTKTTAEITCSNKTYNGNTQTIATCTGGTIANASQKDANNYDITCKGDQNHNDATKKSCSIFKATCNAPTGISIGTDGKVTWTPSNNCKNAQHQISLSATSGFENATSGKNYNSKITASTGNKTIYVKAIAPDNNYNNSSNGSASTTVYSVTLTKGTNINAVSGAGNYIKGRTVTIDATVKTGYSWSKWTNTSNGTQINTTKAYSAPINSNWAYTANGSGRTFTCAAKGQITKYMNRDWYTLSNSGGICELVLNDTIGNGVKYTGSSGTNGSVYTLIKGFSNGTNTIDQEVSAGLITSIDSASNNTNIAGVYWIGDKTVYDSTERKKYTIIDYYVTTGMYNVYNPDQYAGSLQVYTYKEKGSETVAHAANTTIQVNNDYSTITYTSAKLNNGNQLKQGSATEFSSSWKMFVPCYTSQKDSEHTKNSAINKDKVCLDIHSGKYNESGSYKKFSDDESGTFHIYTCGGSYPGKEIRLSNKNSTTKYHYHNFGTGTDEDYSYPGSSGYRETSNACTDINSNFNGTCHQKFKGKRFFAFAGGSGSSVDNGDNNRVFNFSSSSINTGISGIGTVAADSTCQTRIIKSVSNVTVNIQYRPHIKVKTS